MNEWVLQPVRVLHLNGSRTVTLQWRWDGEPGLADCGDIDCKLCL